MLWSNEGHALGARYVRCKWRFSYWAHCWVSATEYKSATPDEQRNQLAHSLIPVRSLSRSFLLVFTSCSVDHSYLFYTTLPARGSLSLVYTMNFWIVIKDLAREELSIAVNRGEKAINQKLAGEVSSIQRGYLLFHLGFATTITMREISRNML